MVNLLAVIAIVTNIGFTVAFDTERRQPSWVSYSLEPDEVILSRRLPYRFSADPRFPESDVRTDYLHSGYDRGHMAPAADFNWSTNALGETYYFSNICPQVPTLNRGRWREIEEEVREFAKSGTVYVVTAPLGYGTNECGRLPVPERFAKVAYGWFGFRVYIEENKNKANEGTNCNEKVGIGR